VSVCLSNGIGRAPNCVIWHRQINNVIGNYVDHMFRPLCSTLPYTCFAHCAVPSPTHVSPTVQYPPLHMFHPLCSTLPYTCFAHCAVPSPTHVSPTVRYPPHCALTPSQSVPHSVAMPLSVCLSHIHNSAPSEPPNSFRLLRRPLCSCTVPRPLCSRTVPPTKVSALP
jgi:hypothetical protein